jgi:hypothetical protein
MQALKGMAALILHWDASPERDGSPYPYTGMAAPDSSQHPNYLNPFQDVFWLITFLHLLYPLLLGITDGIILTELLKTLWFWRFRDKEFRKLRYLILLQLLTGEEKFKIKSLNNFLTL